MTAGSVPQPVVRPSSRGRSEKPPEVIPCAPGAENGHAVRVASVPHLFSEEGRPAFGVRVAEAVTLLTPQSHGGRLPRPSGRQTSAEPAGERVDAVTAGPLRQRPIACRPMCSASREARSSASSSGQFSRARRISCRSSIDRPTCRVSGASALRRRCPGVGRRVERRASGCDRARRGCPRVRQY